MPTFEDHATEYAELMSQGRSIERTGQICWTAGALCAAIMLSWAIEAKSAGLMVPAVFAMAAGYYGMLRARQHARWIESYIEEFHETSNGSQWHSRVHRLHNQTGHRLVSDWLTTIVANAGMILTVMLAWMDASVTSRGDLMAGIVTACAVMFGFHSIYETVRMDAMRRGAAWRQVSGELREAERPRQAGTY